MLDLKQYLEKKNFHAPRELKEIDEKTIFSVFNTIVYGEYGMRGQENIEPRFYKEKAF
jgi:hypothetical protein